MRKIVENQRFILIWWNLGRSPVNALFRADTLLKALSSQAIKTSIDGDCTTSLDNPSNTWLFHAGNVFSWFESETFLHQFTIIVSAWHHLLSNLPARSSRQLSGPCEVTSCPCWMSPIPLASVHRASAPAPDHLGGPSTELTPMSSLHAGTWRTPLDVALQMQMHHFPGSSGHVSISRCIRNPTILSHKLLTCCILFSTLFPCL